MTMVIFAHVCLDKAGPMTRHNSAIFFRGSMTHMSLYWVCCNTHIWAFLAAQTVKNPSAMQDTRLPSLGLEDALAKGKAARSRILAWRIPLTVDPGRLQLTGS